LLWRSADAEPGNDAAHGADVPACLGEECRFAAPDGSCQLTEQTRQLDVLIDRVAQSEERWENMILTLVELTERVEVVLRRFEPREEAPTAAPPRPVPAPTPARRRVLPGRSARQTAQLHLARGRMHYRQGRLEKAAGCFEQAIESDGRCAEALNELGLLETERGNTATAITHFRRALEVAPALEAAYLNLGYVFFLQESYIEAAAMFQEAADRAPDSSTAWTNLGDALEKLGRIGDARRAWQQAVRVDAEDQRAARQLARTTAPAGIV
jgi:tetratricopeptide (TPR) repeat protein